MGAFFCAYGREMAAAFALYGLWMVLREVYVTG